MDDRPAISLVIPVYNEGESIFPLYEAVWAACESLGKPYEVIFVDDGSTDQTFAVLEQLHKKNSQVKVIRFRKNYGQTAATVAGFMHARGNIIVSMDGDLQNDPRDIPRLLAKLEEGYDVVCGWRRNRQDKFWARRVPSLVANRIIGWVTGINIHDNGCSLKAYRSSVIKSLALYGEMHRFIPAMATLTGARIAEIEVNHQPRRFGHSKYGIGRIWRVVLDIITVKMITGFASRPALWFGLPTVPFFILGLSALFFAGGVFSDLLVEQWLVISTVAFLFFLVGAHLLTLGIIGELSMKTGDYRPSKTLRPTLTMM